jgi:imidazolonepropionase-like amidohydrolase
VPCSLGVLMIDPRRFAATGRSSLEPEGVGDFDLPMNGTVKSSGLSSSEIGMTLPRIRRASAAALFMTLSFGALAAATDQSSSGGRYPDIALEHVTVLSMSGKGVQEFPNATVIIHDGRITSVTAAVQAGVPKGVRRIDGTGKWLMPGLTDMHVHTSNDRMGRLFLKDPTIRDGTLRPQDIFTPYIVNGVLQVLDLQSMSETVGQRVEIESGRVLGPRMLLAGMIDGSPPYWPVGMTRVAVTPEDGRQAVRDVAAEGYDFIKVYSRLDLETFTAIVDEAHRLNMRVIGHIPERGKGITEKFFQPGFDLVAHAEEFAQQTDPPDVEAIPRYVEMSKRNGTWLIGTLTVDERILEELTHPETLRTRPEIRALPGPMRSAWIEHNPYIARTSPGFIQSVQRIIEFNQKLVRAFVAAEIPVLAGTDSTVPGVVPGFALHDELELMAKAGMSNWQVLESTTRLACEWLRVDQDRGTVEPGKRADLLLLNADPLADVSNTRKIAAVIVRGRYLPRAELDRMLGALTEHRDDR